MSASAAAGNCPRCLFRECVCAAVPNVPTRTRILIVRHAGERMRSSNSGRLAHLALPNSEIVEYGALGVPQEALSFGDLQGAMLLYPLGEPALSAPQPPPRTLVILDATWSQARRMFRKLAVLRGLPTLRLPDEPMPAARLRESPGPGRVSTIEAIARALRLLEGDGAALPLESLFSAAVASALRSGRNMPS
ncbi:MAG TPA: tRNA-uridine aminocarboxypropyltransferase [Kofleriaceae bacterium]|jgi:DTW domain-containing protein YfiP